MMISDASGIAFEFLFLGKPVVFLDVPDYFSDKRYLGAQEPKADLSFWGRRYGTVVSTLHRLVPVVTEILRQPVGHQAGDLTELKELLLYNSGTAGEAACYVIEHLLLGRTADELNANLAEVRPYERMAIPQSAMP